ncbi:hypothetical protein F2Q69_00034727 [Brassica cretica]|uniref:Uncharacterized protein n=1 Tax=Brassica cretica TaxID=69181 RepID=A0A8S9SHC9_BRACR|nr:hypothetical protein F2Q69_00034727 [Brassica cretica]
MGEEMMETGRPVGHLGRVVKDPKSGNKFDVSELQDEENLSPAKKKHYYRHTNSQIQANGSYIEFAVIHIQLNIYSLVIFLLWSMALFSGDARQSCNGKVVTSHFFVQALIDKCAHTIALTQALTAVF